MRTSGRRSRCCSWWKRGPPPIPIPIPNYWPSSLPPASKDGFGGGGGGGGGNGPTRDDAGVVIRWSRAAPPTGFWRRRSDGGRIWTAAPLVAAALALLRAIDSTGDLDAPPPRWHVAPPNTSAKKARNADLYAALKINALFYIIYIICSR